MKKLYLFLFCGLLCTANLNAQTWQIGVPLAPASVTATLQDGTLTISGTGAMANWGEGSSPWFNVRNSIRTVVINNGVTTIGNFAFLMLENLTSVTIPNSVTTIGDAAFWICPALTSITIPNGVTTIGNSAFSMSGLTSVDIPNSVTTIGEAAFFQCSALASATISNNVRTIGDATFAGTALTSVVIPNSVTRIGNNAFGSTALTSVTIGSGVTTIDQSAFTGNANLREIINLNPVPQQLHNTVFWGVNTALVELFVMGCNAVVAYGNAFVWRDFGKISNLEYQLLTESLWESIANLQSEISALQNENNRLNSENSILQIENNSLQNQNNALQTANDVSQTLNNTLLESISWLQQLLANCEAETGTSNISENQIQIFPNPVTHELRIIKHNWQANDVVELFDMSGRLVFSKCANTHTGEFVIDMSPFQSGSYILRIGNRVAKVVKL